MSHVRVDKDADGRITAEEVKEVRVYQIKKLRSPKLEFTSFVIWYI